MNRLYGKTKSKSLLLFLGMYSWLEPRIRMASRILRLCLNEFELYG